MRPPDIKVNPEAAARISSAFKGFGDAMRGAGKGAGREITDGLDRMVLAAHQPHPVGEAEQFCGSCRNGGLPVAWPCPERVATSKRSPIAKTHERPRPATRAERGPHVAAP